MQTSYLVSDTASLSAAASPIPSVSDLSVVSSSPETISSDSLSDNHCSLDMYDSVSSEPVTADVAIADELDQSCASSTLVAICDDDALTAVCCDASNCSNCSPALVVVDPALILSCLHALMCLQHQPIFATKLSRKFKPLTFFTSTKSAVFPASFSFLVGVWVVVLFVPSLFMTLLVPRNWKKRLKLLLALHLPCA
jgi:hypothetical protein